MTEEYPVMEKIVSEAYALSEDELTRELMMLREEAIRVRRTEEAIYKEAFEENARLKAEHEELITEHEKLTKSLSDQQAENQKLADENEKITADYNRLVEKFRNLGYDPLESL